MTLRVALSVTNINFTGAIQVNDLAGSFNAWPVTQTFKNNTFDMVFEFPGLSEYTFFVQALVEEVPDARIRSAKIEEMVTS